MKLILDVATGTVTAHRISETGQPLCGVRAAKRRQFIVQVEDGSVPPEWLCLCCRDALASMAIDWVRQQRKFVMKAKRYGRNGRWGIERTPLGEKPHKNLTDRI